MLNGSFAGHVRKKVKNKKPALTPALSPRLIIAHKSVGFSVNPKGIASSSPGL